jgi:hypothetical protein
VLDVGILPLASGPEAAVEIAANQGADVAAGIRGQLLRGIADNAGVHLVFKETSAEAVLAGEDRPGLDIAAQFALVDLPCGEQRGVPELLLVGIVCQARLDLVLPETQAWVQRRIRVVVPAGGVPALVDRVIGLVLVPSKPNGFEEDVRNPGGFGGGVEEVGVEPGVKHRDHKCEAVISAEDLLRQNDIVRSDDAADIDIGPQYCIAARALNRVNRLNQAKSGSVKAGRSRGSIFKAGETSDVVPQLLCPQQRRKQMEPCNTHRQDPDSQRNTSSSGDQTRLL